MVQFTGYGEKQELINTLIYMDSQEEICLNPLITDPWKMGGMIKTICASMSSEASNSETYLENFFRSYYFPFGGGGENE